MAATYARYVSITHMKHRNSYNKIGLDQGDLSYLSEYWIMIEPFAFGQNKQCKIVYCFSNMKCPF